MSRVLPWLPGGLLLGAVFFAAILLAKPIGVSTQFVILDAMLWDLVDPSVITETPDSKTGYASSNAYLDKSGGKYAQEAANPLNYSFVFVGAMMVGALLSSLIGGDRPQPGERAMPPVWRARFGDAASTRFAGAFVAGFLVLFGARLAGGCTSGHMMSGVMQSALSGYLFTGAAFLAGIPTAIVLFGSRRG